MLKACIDLYKEISVKKFPKNKPNAYLSCFLSLGAVYAFMKAVEEEAKKQGVSLE